MAGTCSSFIGRDSVSRSKAVSASCNNLQLSVYSQNIVFSKRYEQKITPVTRLITTTVVCKDDRFKFTDCSLEIVHLHKDLSAQFRHFMHIIGRY